MVDDATIGVQSAHAWAWVATLVVGAVFVARAVVVEDTLWPTARVRVPVVVVLAGADADAVLLLAVGVRSAR